MGASHRLQRLGALLLLATLALTGCQQATPPTAVVTLGPPLPPPLTPTVKSAPPTVPPLAATRPTATATTAAEELTPTLAERPSEGLALTVLHTNDVAGYIDPCG